MKFRFDPKYQILDLEKLIGKNILDDNSNQEATHCISRAYMRNSLELLTFTELDYKAHKKQI